MGRTKQRMSSRSRSRSTKRKLCAMSAKRTQQLPQQQLPQQQLPQQLPQQQLPQQLSQLVKNFREMINGLESFNI